MSAVTVILPVFAVIVAGYLVAATGILAPDRWEGINALNFRVLIPATLIHSIAVSDLGSLASARYIAAILGTLAVISAVALGLRFLPRERLPDPAFTTLFQSGTRWNAFIALAAAGQLSGARGVALMALAMAILIPLINVLNVIVLTIFGTGKASLPGILRQVLSNPLVIGCLAGLVLNFWMKSLGLPFPPALMDATDMVGRAALGMGLLCVGAGITFRRLLHMGWQILLAVPLRLLLCPAVFLGLACLLRLSPQEAQTGVLIFAVPTAAAGYVIARAMGGDADLYADILTWQTVLGMLTLPLWLRVAHLVV